jgi:hypothetical protein
LKKPHAGRRPIYPKEEKLHALLFGLRFGLSEIFGGLQMV